MNRYTHRQTKTYRDLQSQTETSRHTYRYIHIQRQRLTDSQTDRQTDRQADIHIDSARLAGI